VPILCVAKSGVPKKKGLSMSSIPYTPVRFLKSYVDASNY